MSSGSDSWGSLGFVIVVIVQRLDFRLEWDGMTLRNELKLKSRVIVAPLKRRPTHIDPCGLFDVDVDLNLSLRWPGSAAAAADFGHSVDSNSCLLVREVPEWACTYLVISDKFGFVADSSV
jgi:hypothetical protein